MRSRHLFQVAAFVITVTIEHLNNLTFLIIGFFTVRLIAYGFGYTQGQIGGGAVSRQIRLYLGDKFKRIPLSRFHQGQIGQYVNTMTSDVSNYEQILTHRTGNLVKNISLSVMLILFVCFLYLPAGLILIAISLLFIPNMWLSFRIVKKYGNARNSVCAEAVSSIVEYVNGIQTLRAYGMGGTRNKTITDILREYSQVSYKYEATGIPVLPRSKGMRIRSRIVVAIECLIIFIPNVFEAYFILNSYAIGMTISVVSRVSAVFLAHHRQKHDCN